MLHASSTCSPRIAARNPSAAVQPGRTPCGPSPRAASQPAAVPRLQCRVRPSIHPLRRLPLAHDVGRPFPRPSPPRPLGTQAIQSCCLRPQSSMPSRGTGHARRASLCSFGWRALPGAFLVCGCSGWAVRCRCRPSQSPMLRVDLSARRFILTLSHPHHGMICLLCRVPAAAAPVTRACPHSTAPASAEASTTASPPPSSIPRPSIARPSHTSPGAVLDSVGAADCGCGA